MKKSMVAILVALLTTSSFAVLANRASADSEIDRTWVRAQGRITRWGSTPVFGMIDIRVKSVSLDLAYYEWAAVYAVWSYEPNRLNCTEPPTENFTFTCWTARLVKISIVAFNYSGYDLFISGKWNVVKITTTVEVDQYGQIIRITRIFERVVTEADGELRVFPIDGASALRRPFELSIAGIDPLSGFIFRYVETHFDLQVYDVNDDGKVTIVELTRAAKRYGAVPGLWNYDIEFDTNGDGRIDIGDLATMAANIQA